MLPHTIVSHNLSATLFSKSPYLQSSFHCFVYPNLVCHFLPSREEPFDLSTDTNSLRQLFTGYKTFHIPNITFCYFSRWISHDKKLFSVMLDSDKCISFLRSYCDNGTFSRTIKTPRNSILVVAKKQNSFRLLISVPV